MTVEPFLRWAGSKRQSLNSLSKYWRPEFERYVEPFAGSACLFFRLNPRRAVLGDINKELINTYRAVKLFPRTVGKFLDVMPRGRDAYLAVRELDTAGLSPIGRAVRFIYLNRYCFNGLYRTNLAGHFNVPYGGGTRTGTLSSCDDLVLCSARLQAADLVAGDFDSVLASVRPGDFVYMDPPYRVDAQRTFREYDPSTFGDAELARLRGWMLDLDRRGIQFLVSYADCAEADALKVGFSVDSVTVKRNIAGFAAKRGTSKEVLIYNRPVRPQENAT